MWGFLRGLVSEEPLGRAFQGALFGSFELLDGRPFEHQDFLGDGVSLGPVASYVEEGFHDLLK